MFIKSQCPFIYIYIKKMFSKIQTQEKLFAVHHDTFLLPGRFTLSHLAQRELQPLVRVLRHCSSGSSAAVSCPARTRSTGCSLLEPQCAGEWHARRGTSARWGSREGTPSAARGEGGFGDRDAQRWKEINEVLMWAVRSLKADSRRCNRGRVLQNVPLWRFPTQMNR